MFKDKTEILPPPPLISVILWKLFLSESALYWLGINVLLKAYQTFFLICFDTALGDNITSCVNLTW